MAALRSRYGHYVFALWFLSFFSSPDLSGRWLDVFYHFYTWCGLCANLKCMPEKCCTRLAGNTGASCIQYTGRKQIALWALSYNFVGQL